ncbi:MAG: hypothetical protein KAQ90_03755, partial [Melioribacteraceae bacterium]|nr:hypothetical protein [Melioribacteraceae bacterium]
NNQAVLMRGVNDDAEIMKELMLNLLKMRVRPYYLFMADETKGAMHFRTTIEEGLEIMDKLRGHISGLAIPYFCIDAPGGGGKIPLLPKYVMHQDEEKIILRNYKNEHYVYKNLTENKEENIIDNKIQIEITDKKNGDSINPKKFDDITSVDIEKQVVSDN